MLSQVSSKTGWTPLHYAVHSGHALVTRMLASNGADVSAPDQDGTSRFGGPTGEGFEVEVVIVEVYSCYLDSSSVAGTCIPLRSPLLLAANLADPNLTIALTLLKRGAPLEQRSNASNWTPLHYAAETGSSKPRYTLHLDMLADGRNRVIFKSLLPESVLQTDIYTPFGFRAVPADIFDPAYNASGLERVRG